MTNPTLRFLYRDAGGKIGPGQWARASAAPVAAALALTMLALAIVPMPRNLRTQPFFSWSIFAVHVYFIIYGFSLIFLAVAQYFVSAKRFRDLGMSPGWAGLAPFSLFLLGAALWFQPRSEGLMPTWCIYPFLMASAAAIVWSIFELGFVKGKRNTP